MSHSTGKNLLPYNLIQVVCKKKRTEHRYPLYLLRAGLVYLLSGHFPGATGDLVCSGNRPTARMALLIHLFSWRRSQTICTSFFGGKNVENRMARLSSIFRSCVNFLKS